MCYICICIYIYIYIYTHICHTSCDRRKVRQDAARRDAAWSVVETTPRHSMRRASGVSCEGALELALTKAAVRI